MISKVFINKAVSLWIEGLTLVFIGYFTYIFVGLYQNDPVLRSMTFRELKSWILRFARAVVYDSLKELGVLE